MNGDGDYKNAVDALRGVAAGKFAAALSTTDTDRDYDKKAAQGPAVPDSADQIYGRNVAAWGARASGKRNPA